MRCRTPRETVQSVSFSLARVHFDMFFGMDKSIDVRSERCRHISDLYRTWLLRDVEACRRMQSGFLHRLLLDGHLILVAHGFLVRERLVHISGDRIALIPSGKGHGLVQLRAIRSGMKNQRAPSTTCSTSTASAEASLSRIY
uniref:Uncharacterized protein n=1 Tax=Peronospora matthiolae TaxID=2874970 RepID=A0AAV1UND3_9STRA